jgi:5-methylcytosine-specific restriction endonuclease McrA
MRLFRPFPKRRSLLGLVVRQIVFNANREVRTDYYRNDYLKSEAWQRKRYLVFKRDNYKCVYCGAKATQIHHLKYAKNIGKEPIQWLVSVCNDCHNSKH